MKQKLFKSLVVRSLAFIMLMMCAVPASAQYYMNVYKNDGQKYQFLVSSIDSVCVVFESYNNHEWVDLGLSVKWATCNIGAESPEGYGSYFAWGETSPKSNYTWGTYKHNNGGSYGELTKYCNFSSDGYKGYTDTKTTLDLIDDAAHVNGGGSWRMPTKEDWDELRDSCVWTWTTLNGVKGYKVVSKSNGNSLFLPAAGVRTSTGDYDVGLSGHYWSSLLFPDGPRDAWSLYFGSDDVRWSGYGRNSGNSVRAVCL